MTTKLPIRLGYARTLLKTAIVLPSSILSTKFFIEAVYVYGKNLDK
ncbi:MULTISPECIES: hypothetical protein [Rickettsieae]|nr:hypothetical protein [Rickettsia endosymbiont of Culicoides newsteadi]